MKRLIILSTLLVCGWAHAAGANTNRVSLGFTWVPLVSDMAGLSTNEYLTNITFRVYSTTNVALPLANWTQLAEWPAVNFLSQGPCGALWISQVTVDGASRFYVARSFSSKASGDGLSPFSNTDFQLALPPSGTIQILK